MLLTTLVIACCVFLFPINPWCGRDEICTLQMRNQVRQYEDMLKILFKGSWIQSRVEAAPKSSYYPMLSPQGMAKFITKAVLGSPTGPVMMGQP